MHYDRLGRCVGVQDAHDHTTTLHYNARDHLIGIDNALGEHLEFDYDATYRLVALSDAAQRRTRYSYDAYGRLHIIQRPDGRERHYSYHDNDTLKQMIDESGRVHTFAYNVNRYRTEHTVADTFLRYDYDCFGNLISAATPNNRLSLEYDVNANIISQTLDNRTLKSDYTPQRRRNTLRLDGETLCRYHRDDSGRLQSLQTPHHAITVTSDALGVRTCRDYPNRHTERMEYDSQYNLQSLHTADITHEYTYDTLGRIEQHNDTCYVYDAASRLIQNTTATFSYDTQGNCQNRNARYHHTSGQLLSNATHTFSYDAQGNCIGKTDRRDHTHTHYRFNAYNQLIEVRRSDAAKNVYHTLSFSYDALNRRIAKTVTTVTSCGEEQHSHYRYLYDNENIVAIYDADYTLLASIIHDEEHVDTPLSITTYDQRSDAELIPLLDDVEQSYFSTLTPQERAFLLNKKRQHSYYYHRDHQGSIIALSDAEGEIVERFTYDGSYGIITEHTKSV